ncbi:hypothetical protein CANARDRAFT_7693 [[Candida] arabinofermentans NRRL YB-2248]|uniref:Uncharacterized protein n=1 Tax=[Candida] arabinofermentans NRRL YB-2248 TaxID=983967 RepID=A0A1E4T1F2_9ASCO|nr:hypothetical protein CANARDRAFT_7693 [[Candida] arabinofermentans NRRL YB-2248]
MSRAAKATLAFSCFLTVGTAVGVYYLAEEEKDALKLGPVKDAARLERRRVRELNAKQQANLVEFEQQKKLRQELESSQPLSGHIIEGVDKRL